MRTTYQSVVRNEVKKKSDVIRFSLAIVIEEISRKIQNEGFPLFIFNFVIFENFSEGGNHFVLQCNVKFWSKIIIFEDIVELVCIQITRPYLFHFVGSDFF